MELFTNLIELIKTPKPIFDYTCPSQVRKIPPKTISYRGLANSTKLHYQELTNSSFDYESHLEFLLIIALDHDYYCYDLQPQPIKIDWFNKNGKKSVCYPDIWAVFASGKQVLYQVKPAKQLQTLWNDENWQLQVKEIEKTCTSLNWELKFITEYDLLTTRITNIRKLRYFALHHPNKTLIEEVTAAIFQVYSNSSQQLGFSYAKLIDQIHRKNNLTKPDIKSVVNWLLYYQLLVFDWQKILTDQTDIYLNLKVDQRLLPFYQVLSTQSLSTSNGEIDNDTNIIYMGYDPTEFVSERDLEKANQRYLAIQPLVESKVNYSIEAIKNQSKESSVHWQSLYSWIKKFEKNGFKGLITQNQKKGNRQKKVESAVDEIITKWIKEYPKGFRSIRSLHEAIKLECLSVKSDPPLQTPDYVTIWKRVKKQKAKYRQGLQGGFIRHEIAQPIIGELYAGERPLDLIQIDHTSLDIILVDQFNGKALGRPWLTVAIDTFSRMIFGYYLSFESPNKVKVTRTLLTGILPKEELLKRYAIDDYSYPIYGIPTTLQVDNALEFQSNHLKFFCISNKIDLQFRMVKDPTKGAFVERFFETIRLGLMGLSGYTSTITTRKKKNYNPEKAAEQNGWTLAEFDKWFLLFILKYHRTKHTSLGQSPQNHYEIGIQSGLATKAILPVDLNRLKIEVLPVWDKQVKVNKYGIRWLYNHYNNDMLHKIRARHQGVTSIKINFRYDPRDIRKIWIYNDGTKSYHAAELKNGPLAKFFRENDIPISYSEYALVRTRLKLENKHLEERNVANELSALLNEYIIEMQKKKPKKKLTKKLEAKLAENNLDLNDLLTEQKMHGKSKRKIPKIMLDDEDIEILPTSERRV